MSNKVWARIGLLCVVAFFALYFSGIINYIPKLDGIYNFSINYDSDDSYLVGAREKQYVYLGGMPIGLTLNAQGVIIIGITEIETQNGCTRPGKEAGLEVGDIITQIDDQNIDGIKSLDTILNSEGYNGGAKKIKYIRKDKEYESVIIPALDKTSGRYKLGLWLRDNAAGIGTLTYIRPIGNQLRFGALGHPISDPDTGTVIPVRGGEVYRCNIVGVSKSVKGTPGEIKGIFLKEKKRLGEIDKNNKFGVFGTLNEVITNPLYPKPIEVASRKSIKSGKAKIVTTVDKQIKEYDIEIIKTNMQTSCEEKSMVIKITDPELIEKTGGIVQGMSGSPIIQNGKLVGAVTHVFINDPTKGFGVYLDWMFEQ